MIFFFHDGQTAKTTKKIIYIKYSLETKYSYKE